MRSDVGARADAGALEDARRLDGARGEDDAGEGLDAKALAALVLPAHRDRPLPAHLDGVDAMAFQDPGAARFGVGEVGDLEALLSLRGARFEAAAAPPAVQDVAADRMAAIAEALGGEAHEGTVASEERVARGGDGEVLLDPVEARLELGEGKGLLRAGRAEAARVGVLGEAPDDGPVHDRGAAHAPPLQHGHDAPPHRDLGAAIAEEAEERLARTEAPIGRRDHRPFFEHHDAAPGLGEHLRRGRAAGAAPDDDEVGRVDHAWVTTARTGGR